MTSAGIDLHQMPKVTLKRLLKISADIADGMHYIATMGTSVHTTIVSES